jgi:hypothetical protein
MPECDEACSKRGIPVHLHQLDRTANQDFSDPEELLWRRFPFEAEDLTSIISFNGMSVNRQKDGESPDDVLWDTVNGGRHHGYGVVEFSVGSLQRCWDHPEPVGNPLTFSLVPEHKPEQCNYPHSEVVAHLYNRSTTELQCLTKIKPTSVKLKIREDLQSSIRIVLPIKRSGDRFPISL